MEERKRKKKRREEKGKERRGKTKGREDSRKLRIGTSLMVQWLRLCFQYTGCKFIPSDLGARRPCRGLRGWGCAHCQSLPRVELFPRERKRPRLHSQAGASPPRLRTARRESGSRCPWLGEAAPQPECCSVCAQKAPARPGLPWSCPAA